jgi:hypothetical protein
MTKVANYLLLTFVSFFMVFSFTGCDLTTSSGAISPEDVDQVVREELAGLENQATAAKSSSSSSPSSSSSSSGGGSGGLRGKVSGCSISGSFGSETGSFAGDTHNGNRPHYRFSKSGGSYGSNIRVTARTTSGTKTWTVPKGSSRHTE